MRTLIVNDDGVDSPGIAVLARVAYEAGLDVTVAAPSVDRSGTSAALTSLEENGRMVIERRTIVGLPDVEVTAVEASPAMIVFVSASGAFGPEPELVLSGINHGPNTGHAVLHSGTVGAAFTAANQGARAVALSMDSATPEHWDTAAEVARRAIDWVGEAAPPGTVLNVNIPDVAVGSLRGIRPAPLAAFGAVQAEITDTSSTFVAVSFLPVRAGESERSDSGLLRTGWATVTLIRAPSEISDIDLSGLTTG